MRRWDTQETKASDFYLILNKPQLSDQDSFLSGGEFVPVIFLEGKAGKVATEDFSYSIYCYFSKC